MRLGALLLLVAFARVAAAITPAEIEAAASKATGGLRADVKRLVAPAMGGRDNGTPESNRVQRRLVKRLRRLGPGLLGGGRDEEAYRQHFVEEGQPGTNLLAVMRGRDLPEQYVIVGGHYDHLDSRSDAAGNCAARRTPGGALCPGATDNAAGAAVVLAIGRALRALPTPPRRSVILALWDAEEDGLLGSRHYVNHPPVPIAQTVAYVNFDIQGANLLPSLRRTSFAVGAETGGSALGAFVADAVAADELDTRPVSYIFGQLRSDYANFVNASVPTVFFGDSTGGCYHTTGDTFAVVDLAKLRMQSRIGFRLAAALAETSTPPPFRAPSPALATYADAGVIHDVFSRAQADLILFPPTDQMLLQRLSDELAAVVQGGPEAFGSEEVIVTLNAALQGIGALTRLPCQKF
jgi:hypothetical protein